MDERDRYYHSFLARSIPILSEDGIRKLKSTTIALAGLGGVGSAAVITLARLGVGGFKLADPGRFDLPDINRQWAAFKSTLGKGKTEIYEKVLRDINPDIKIEKFNEGVTKSNLDLFLDESDIVVECLDYVLPTRGLREEVFEKARERDIPVISSGICGFGAFMIGYSPNGMRAAEFYGTLQERVKKKCSITENVSTLDILLNLLKENFDSSVLNIIGEQFTKHHLLPSLSLAPALSASLVATECIIILLKNILPSTRKPIYAPRFVTVDLLTNNYKIIDATKL